LDRLNGERPGYLVTIEEAEATIKQCAWQIFEHNKAINIGLAPQ
jgi:hypothetical protein